MLRAEARRSVTAVTPLPSWRLRFRGVLIVENDAIGRANAPQPPHSHRGTRWRLGTTYPHPGRGGTGICPHRRLRGRHRPALLRSWCLH